jgi:hypothetical protein
MKCVSLTIAIVLGGMVLSSRIWLTGGDWESVLCETSGSSLSQEQTLRASSVSAEGEPLSFSEALASGKNAYFTLNGGCLFLISPGQSPTEAESRAPSPGGPGLEDLYDAVSLLDACMLAGFLYRRADHDRRAAR